MSVSTRQYRDSVSLDYHPQPPPHRACGGRGKGLLEISIIHPPDRKTENRARQTFRQKKQSQFSRRSASVPRPRVGLWLAGVARAPVRAANQRRASAQAPRRLAPAPDVPVNRPGLGKYQFLFFPVLHICVVDPWSVAVVSLGCAMLWHFQVVLTFLCVIVWSIQLDLIRFW